MKLMRVANSKYWYVQFPGRKRFSTKCEDEKAAHLVAIQMERALAIVDILKSDSSGVVADMIRDHLNGEGRVVKDKAPVGARGRVYFIECPAKKLIKIGFTTDLPSRLRTMRTSATDEIRVLGSFEATRFTEKTLHGKFLKLRKFGEWFEDAPEIRQYISETLGFESALSDVA